MEGEQVRLGLEFEDLEAFYARIPPKLWAFFDRRGGSRVTPMLAPEKRVSIELRIGAHLRSESLGDISVVGLGLRLSKADALDVPTGADCTGRLALPGVDEVFHLVLRPVHHSETPAALRVGFRIEEAGDSDTGD